jgi:radical SAM superfamily enzyme YgiQ (UPF0313 family)
MDNGTKVNNGKVILIALYDLDSLSVRTLHAVLSNKGFDVHSIFFKRQESNNTMVRPTQNDMAALIKVIKEHSPLFVGISVRSTLYQLACEVTEKIKSEVSIPVVWGGIHPTVKPEQCVQTADIVCVGEGEEAIVELANSLQDAKSIKQIKNLWIKNEEGLTRNELRPLIQELDALPFPDYSDHNKLFIESGEVHPVPSDKDRTIYWMMTSRGCMFNCTYCCNNSLKKAYKGLGRYLRRRSPRSVIDELMYMKQNFLPNLDFIVFVDDIFVYDISWLKEFAIEYKKNINLPFCCFFHPKVINEGLAAVLKDAGVEFMIAGIQSGSEDLRKKYFKRFESNETIMNSAKILQRYEIDSAYNIILDNPVEQESDHIETLKLLLKMPRPYELQPTTLTHFPETELTKLLLTENLIDLSDVEDIRQKSFERWSLVLDPNRDNRQLFWDMLFYLANKKHIPRKLVFMLSKLKWLKKNPRPLVRILRDMNPYLRTGTRYQRLLDITFCQIAQNEKETGFIRKMRFVRHPIRSILKHVRA